MQLEAPADKKQALRLVEVFSSIQGEGVLVGRRQVFIRTYGCNLRCSYCDSPETLKESGSPPTCRVERSPGTWKFDRIPNPVDADLLTSIVRSYATEPHHSLSVTGGEPLLHAAFLDYWLPEVRSLRLKVFLETNGLLVSHLKRVVRHLDYISMDFKPASALPPGVETDWDRHREFLLAATQAFVYCKLVVTPSTTDNELDCVTDTIADVDRSIPLILQPVTPCGREPVATTSVRIMEVFERASRRLDDVRVIPQTHKMMRLL
jgi:7-carboxy-7-deazaguanine synthase